MKQDRSTVCPGCLIRVNPPGALAIILSVDNKNKTFYYSQGVLALTRDGKLHMYPVSEQHVAVFV